MSDDLKKYCDQAVGFGFTHAKVIDPASVVTAAWVRLKCRYGCPGYGWSHCCPPETPTPEETRNVLDSYHRTILFHRETPDEPGRWKAIGALCRKLVDLEGEIFKDGYYKALVFVAGPCSICKTCSKTEGKPCNFGAKARPSMESAGIDVYRTARNNGFHIEPLKEKHDTMNTYCLMLID